MRRCDIVQSKLLPNHDFHIARYDLGKEMPRHLLAIFMFANMSKENDTGDAGKNVPLGRWHDLATGTGVAVCASTSEIDLQTWACHWKDLCSCKITPVLTDAQFRQIVQSKPDFAKKQASLLEKMNPPKKWAWF